MAPNNKMMVPERDPEFPCALTIDLPLPTPRLASAALQALQVDRELSPQVHRSFSLVFAVVSAPASTSASPLPDPLPAPPTVLRTVYKATTNRMLRVAVNGFMESLTVVLGVMAELDLDVLAAAAGGGEGGEDK